VCGKGADAMPPGRVFLVSMGLVGSMSMAQSDCKNTALVDRLAF
jgi:hypothetical protein